MTALTEGRMTPFRDGLRRNFPVAAGANIHVGALVALNASGFLVPATTAAGLICVGRAEEAVNNSGGTDGALSCETGAGIFRYANSAGADQITRADIGANCFAVDDQTVAKTDATATRSIAGKIFDVDTLGVWVQF